MAASLRASSSPLRFWTLACKLRCCYPSDEWRMVLVDLTNHGDSARIKGLCPAPHDMSSAAKDLADLVKARGWGAGHGRMLSWVTPWVERSPWNLRRVVPVAIMVIPLLFPNRRALRHMFMHGVSELLSGWIVCNLQKDNEHVTWGSDLQAATNMFTSYRERSYWSLLENPPKGLEISIVQAEYSDRWCPDDVQRLQALSRRDSTRDAGKVSFHVLPNSGPWVLDNSRGLLDIMGPNFPSIVQK